jgi:hypothetical protein
MKKELEALTKAYRALGGLDASHDEALKNAEKILAWEGNDYENQQKKLNDLCVQYEEFRLKYDAAQLEVQELKAENKELLADRMALLASYRSLLKKVG